MKKIINTPIYVDNILERYSLGLSQKKIYRGFFKLKESFDSYLEVDPFLYTKEGITMYRSYSLCLGGYVIF